MLESSFTITITLDDLDNVDAGSITQEQLDEIAQVMEDTYQEQYFHAELVAAFDYVR